MLLALLGRRWAMRVLWELREPAPSFRGLQSRCDDVSSSVLWQRVGELREAGLVEAREKSGLQLTAAGEELLALFTPLHRFAETWAAARPRAEARAAGPPARPGSVRR